MWRCNASIMPSVGIIDEVNFAISHQIIWRYRLFFVSLHPKHQEQYPERVTRQPGSWKTTVVKVRCGRNIYKLQKIIPSYATTHLLHQVCPAVRRHADSRVSKHLQFPGCKAEAGPVCVPIMIRHSSTSSNTAALTLQPLVMAKPPLSHILSDMTYPTTS